MKLVSLTTLFISSISHFPLKTWYILIHWLKNLKNSITSTLNGFLKFKLSRVFQFTLQHLEYSLQSSFRITFSVVKNIVFHERSSKFILNLSRESQNECSSTGLSSSSNEERNCETSEWKMWKDIYFVVIRLLSLKPCANSTRQESSWNMFFHTRIFGLLEMDYEWNLALWETSGIGRVLSGEITTRVDNFQSLTPFR